MASRRVKPELRVRRIFSMLLSRSRVMTQSTSPTAGRAAFSDRLPSLADIGPLAALVIACAFFIWQSDRVLSIQNLSLILQQAMVVAVIPSGQTLVGVP